MTSFHLCGIFYFHQFVSASTRDVHIVVSSPEAAVNLQYDYINLKLRCHEGITLTPGGLYVCECKGRKSTVVRKSVPTRIHEC